MIGKKLSVKRMFFWLTAGMALTMTAIILVAFFLTKNIVVLWVGMALIVCAILWMLFMVQLLGMRLSNFTSELCQILDDMMNRSQEPENVSDRETIFARIHHRLVRLYNILQESNRKVEAERQELQSLVSDISHQVRTPVSNMKMIVDTLLTKPLEDQERNEFLKSVRGQINKLDFLIQALVKTSRLETGVIQLEKEEHELSGGQQQRAAIARAVYTHPTILLGDELTGNLDSGTSISVMRLLKEICRQYKQTLLIVTHDENVAAMADRIICMKDGKVVKDENV